MLKRLAILAVLVPLATVGVLASQDAPKGTPERGIAKSNGSQNGKAQPQSDDGKQSPKSAVSSPPKPAPQPCDEGCQQGRQNLAIQGKLEWFTGVLALVGVLQAGTMIWQAGLLRETLRAIKRQANLMEKQDLTAREKQRARLSIAFPPDPPETLDTKFNDTELMELYIDVVKDGESNAYDVIASGYVTVTTKTMTGVIFAERGDMLQIPNVIRDAPPEKPVRVCLAPSGFGTFIGVSTEKMESVREGNSLLHIVGDIDYADVFGDGHTMPFHYFWQALDESLREPGDTTVGYWTNISGTPT